MTYWKLILALTAIHLGSATPAFEHAAQDVERRQLQALGMPVAAAAAVAPTTPPALVYTYITPSPGATPVPVTRLGQAVTSHVLQYAACALPPVAQVLQPTPTTWTSTAPYRNHTAFWHSGPGSCTSIYSETVTEVCHTTLSGIVDHYTITSCAQNVTFSTEYGYTLVPASISLDNVTSTSRSAAAPATITAAPPSTVQTLTTYFIAPWQALTSAGPPTDVDLRICSLLTNGTRVCVLESQVWNTTTVTYVATTTTSIDLTTSIPASGGPSQIIFETITANITDLGVPFTLVDTAVLRYEIERETTETSTLQAPSSGVTVAEPADTVYQTYTVLPAVSAPGSGSSLPVRTTTVALTSTITAGTTTVTLSGTPPVPLETGAAGGEAEGERGDVDKGR